MSLRTRLVRGKVHVGRGVILLIVEVGSVVTKPRVEAGISLPTRGEVGRLGSIICRNR